MATLSPFQLNPGVGGDKSCAQLDASGNKHQQVLMEYQVGTADPTVVGPSNPFPVGGSAAAGTAATGIPILFGGVFNSAPPTYGTGQIAQLQADVNGFLKVNIAAGAAAGGTSSNVGSAVPGIATAVGFSDGANMRLGQVDGSGNIKVNIAAGGVPAGQDNTAFTAGTTQGLPALGVFNDGIGALTSGNQGALRCTTDRKLYVALGSSVSGGWSPYTYVAAATPAVQAVKASAGQIGYIQVTNQDTNWVYLKIFNVASGSVTLGVTNANQNFGVPPGGGSVFSVPMALGTAISIAVTGGIALNDNTGITASKTSVNIGFA